MTDDNIKTKAFNGVLWNALNGAVTKILNFIFGILIARRLLPGDYGTFAMIGIFIALAQSLVDSGFGNALVRKQDRTETDFNTVFYFNIIVSAICYLILWICAPFIASFYNTPVLAVITRIVSLSIIVNAICNTQWTKLIIDIDFKKQAIISAISITVTGAVGLVLAQKGFGVWALVWQTLFSSILRCILLWLFIRWIPKLEFSWTSFHDLFSFGSKMLISGIISTIYTNLITLVIGKKYDANSLGYYSRANSFAELPSTYISNTIQSVAYPVLSSLQNSPLKMESYFKAIFKLTCFIVCPLMIGIAAEAGPIVESLLTKTWMGCVPYLRILCIALMFAPISAINRNMIMVLGRSDIYLRLEILRRALGILVIIVTFPFGVKALCLGQIVAIWGDTYLTALTLKKLTGYGPGQEIRDIIHIVAASSVTGMLVLMSLHVFSNSWLQVISGCLIGVFSYLVISLVFKFEELEQVKNLIGSKFPKHV